MIIRLLLVGVLSFLSFSAFADTFKLPENKPVVSFALPDSWKPTETDAGMEARSVDGEIYLAVEFVDTDHVEVLRSSAACGYRLRSVTFDAVVLAMNGVERGGGGAARSR